MVKTELGRFGSGRSSRVAGDFHLGDQFRSRMEEAGNDDFGYVWSSNMFSVEAKKMRDVGSSSYLCPMFGISADI